MIEFVKDHVHRTFDVAKDGEHLLTIFKLDGDWYLSESCDFVRKRINAADLRQIADKLDELNGVDTNDTI